MNVILIYTTSIYFINLSLSTNKLIMFLKHKLYVLFMTKYNIYYNINLVLGTKT